MTCRRNMSVWNHSCPSGHVKLKTLVWYRCCACMDTRDTSDKMTGDVCAIIHRLVTTALWQHRMHWAWKVLSLLRSFHIFRAANIFVFIDLSANHFPFVHTNDWFVLYRMSNLHIWHHGIINKQIFFVIFSAQCWNYNAAFCLNWREVMRNVNLHQHQRPSLCLGGWVSICFAHLEAATSPALKKTKLQELRQFFMFSHVVRIQL